MFNKGSRITNLKVLSSNEQKLSLRQHAPDELIFINVIHRTPEANCLTVKISPKESKIGFASPKESKSKKNRKQTQSVKLAHCKGL